MMIHALLWFLIPLLGGLLTATGVGIAVGSFLGRDRLTYLTAGIITAAGLAMIVPLWM